jgi:hypothetical protein
LYKNGIQRTSFLPAIDLLKTQFDVTDLDSATGPLFAHSRPFSSSLLTHKYPDASDYRRVPRALSHAYFSPLDGDTRAAIDAQFAALTEGTPIEEGKTIRLWGRNLTVPCSAGHVAQFSFAELCGRALGAADYLEITQRFRTLFVKDVPRMGLSEKDKVDDVRVSISQLVMLTFARRGDSLRSLMHATTAEPGCSYRPKFPSLRYSLMTRILGHVYLHRIICVLLWTNW